MAATHPDQARRKPARTAQAGRRSDGSDIDQITHVGRSVPAIHGTGFAGSHRSAWEGTYRAQTALCTRSPPGPVKLIDILQGKWLGHPLHPAIVHLPVGAWLTALALDVIGHYRPTNTTVPHLGLYCVIAGLIGALLAVPTGVAEWTPIKKEKPAWKIGLYHMALNLLAALIWATNLGLRWRALSTSEPVTTAVLSTSIVGTILLVISAYLGSLMVFDQGTSIARQSKKKWRALAQRGGANLPEPK